MIENQGNSFCLKISLHTITSLYLRSADNMLRPLLLCICILNLVLCSSCNKEKLKAPTASFMVVSNPAVSSSADQGENSQKITDIWLYVDGNYQGAFPIGNTMPIVAKNNANIAFLAGIKNNGISATRQPYSFYKKIEFTKDIEAGKTYTYNPVFEYKDDLDFIIEAFSTTIGTTYTNAGDTSYSITNDPAKTYGGIGGTLFMGMSDAKPVAKIISNIPYPLPAYGALVYLELDYKCNQQIVVGVSGYDSNGDGPERPAIALNPTEGWNKIYIQLSTAISTTPVYSNYKIYFKAIKTPLVENPEIYLDNIKVIY